MVESEEANQAADLLKKASRTIAKSKAKEAQEQKVVAGIPQNAALICVEKTAGDNETGAPKNEAAPGR